MLKSALVVLLLAAPGPEVRYEPSPMPVVQTMLELGAVDA